MSESEYDPTCLRIAIARRAHSKVNDLIQFLTSPRDATLSTHGDPPPPLVCFTADYKNGGKVAQHAFPFRSGRRRTKNVIGARFTTRFKHKPSPNSETIELLRSREALRQGTEEEEGTAHIFAIVLLQTEAVVTTTKSKEGICWDALIISYKLGDFRLICQFGNHQKAAVALCSASAL